MIFLYILIRILFIKHVYHVSTTGINICIILYWLYLINVVFFVPLNRILFQTYRTLYITNKVTQHCTGEKAATA